MPKVVVQRPDQLILLDLQGVSRFDMAHTMWDQVPCLSLVYRFVPSPMAVVAGTQMVDLQPMAIVALARARFPQAKSLSEMGNMAGVSLGHGSAEADKERMSEAANLFRNGTARARETDMGASLEEAGEVIDAWWRITAWARAGMSEVVELTAAGSHFRLQP